ncbi:hypothetical protein TDIS_0057 [Thermosulfurimonas dismutans]|uniref:Uncharacterized protein n=2 Tax=Thermosulfurimonas dismutans TaxID=999894 RepID=A0A179D724_9BACT|nr:hypothetical protein TDIS_0057 [Thermosulfurimonas dismutans]
MEKIPQYLDLPVRVKPKNLRSEVQNLSEEWKKTCERSECFEEGSWHGEIDGSLRKLLQKLGKFFDWFSEHYPTRSKQTKSMLSYLDPFVSKLPEPIMELRAKEWKEIHDYFNDVSHHRFDSDFDTFSKWLEALEYFLLDRFVPKTFDDHKIIDDIIREGEENAKA